jgi:hypothetical protein
MVMEFKGGKRRRSCLKFCYWSLVMSISHDMTARIIIIMIMSGFH